ncbi:MAG: ATP-binding protein [Campylobacterota bacterium]|nr:ATP-binding protein [Campylobacterota bacterium]
MASLVSYLTLKEIVLEYHEDHLKNSITLISLELDEIENLDNFASRAHDATSLRVTVIDYNGVVIAESNTNKMEMENHANRAEVIDSNSNEYGITTRYSKTLKTDFLYVAKRIETTKAPIYIRLSMSLERIMQNFYSLWFNLVGIFIVVTLIAVFISYKMSERIRSDIDQITNYLDEISNKNYKAILKPQYFNEFLQISLLLKNLVKKLASREKQKRKYTAKLRLINKQRSDILSAISHEFKNPIASVMGYAETLHDDPDISVKIRTKFLQKILSNSQKMTHMLDRLALSVKLENNDLSIKPTSFDLCLLTEDIIANISKKYQSRKIIFEGNSQKIHADKTMMELVLTNLIDNALKYSEDDIHVKLTKQSIAVADKGMGIESSEIEKIASKYYRVQKNTWDNSMGIGLAIVTYILKLHHTSLEIKSEVGVGSEFGFNIKELKT